MMAEMSREFVSKADFDALAGAVDIDKLNLDIAWIILCSEYLCCCCCSRHSEILLWSTSVSIYSVLLWFQTLRNFIGPLHFIVIHQKL